MPPITEYKGFCIVHRNMQRFEFHLLGEYVYCNSLDGVKLLIDRIIERKVTDIPDLWWAVAMIEAKEWQKPSTDSDDCATSHRTQ